MKPLSANETWQQVSPVCKQAGAGLFTVSDYFHNGEQVWLLLILFSKNASHLIKCLPPSPSFVNVLVVSTEAF